MSTVEQMEDAERTAWALVRYYEADEDDNAVALLETLDRYEIYALITFLIGLMAEYEEE